MADIIIREWDTYKHTTEISDNECFMKARLNACNEARKAHGLNPIKVTKNITDHWKRIADSGCSKGYFDYISKTIVTYVIDIDGWVTYHHLTECANYLQGYMNAIQHFHI